MAKSSLPSLHSPAMRSPIPRHHPYFSGRLPGEPGLASSPLGFLPPLMPEETISGQVAWIVFMGWMPFLCQLTNSVKTMKETQSTESHPLVKSSSSFRDPWRDS